MRETNFYSLQWLRDGEHGAREEEGVSPPGGDWNWGEMKCCSELTLFSLFTRVLPATAGLFKTHGGAGGWSSLNPHYLGL